MGAYGLLYTNLRYTPEGQRCEENGVETIGVSYPPGRVSWVVYIHSGSFEYLAIICDHNTSKYYQNMSCAKFFSI